jgi:hypothetical protein
MLITKKRLQCAKITLIALVSYCEVTVEVINTENLVINRTKHVNYYLNLDVCTYFSSLILLTYFDSSGGLLLINDYNTMDSQIT